MSNPNKAEINKAYGEAVRKSVSNVINNTGYGMTGLNFNEVASTGTNINYVYSNKTISTGKDFKLMDVDTQPNRNYRHYDVDVVNDIESLYPKIINCSPQYLTVEMKKETVTAMNAMMKIKDVEIIIPNKVVKVTFNDNTFEKAICHKDDEFNLETAITVCIAKHLLGGSAKFNNIVSKALKLYNNKIKAEEKAKEEQARIEAKREKNHERLMKHIAKKEKEAREARINELAEAIVRAKELKNNVPETSRRCYPEPLNEE